MTKMSLRLLVAKNFKVMLLAFALGSCSYFAAKSLFGNELIEHNAFVDSSPQPANRGTSSFSEAYLDSRVKSILVMGVDQGGSNTDSIFIVEPGELQSCVMQIPRDGRVFNGLDMPVKVNSLYGHEGIDATKRTLSGLSGKEISRYLVVSLDETVALIGILGGVEITVPKKMYYVDNAQGLYIDLEPGSQLLIGNDLEGFLRWRADSSGDLGRMKRQQLVIQAAVEKIKRADDEVLIAELVDYVHGNAITDMHPIEMMYVLKKMNGSKLSTATFNSRSSFEDKVWYQIIDWSVDSSPPEGCSPH